MSIDPRSDEQLFVAFLAGEEPAFTELFNRYDEPVWRYAWNQSWHRDKPTVDALRQEVLLRTFKGIKNGKFNSKEPGSFKNWIYEICRNVCKESNRQFKRREQPLSERYPDAFPDDIADPRPEPADYDQTQSALDKALAELPDEDRQLLMLIAENKTYEEIHQIPPFDKDSPANLRQKTCRLRRVLVVLLKKK